MKNLFNYTLYRVFDYFEKHDEKTAISKTINFMSLLQGTLIVPLFILINTFIDIEPKVFGTDNRIKYFIGIPLAIILIAINNFTITKKLKGDALNGLRDRFYKEKYSINVWLIFLLPVFFVFVCPILFGVFNGTISFPFLEK
jgi:surface polysaccharide O-acyltransferase-like enzyme